ncbi:unnamed protein product, partial [Rotaria sordida]
PMGHFLDNIMGGNPNPTFGQMLGSYYPGYHYHVFHYPYGWY